MIFNKCKVYLSGPMEYAADGGEGWREVAEQHLLLNNFDVFNPCKSSVRILEQNKLTDAAHYNELKKTIQDNNIDYAKYLAVTKQFIVLDLLELRTSHIVLVKVDKTASGGTAGELTLAYHLGIPVVGFCTGEINEVSGWILGCINDFHYLTKDQLADPLYQALNSVTYRRQGLIQ